MMTMQCCASRSQCMSHAAPQREAGSFARFFLDYAMMDTILLVSIFVLLGVTFTPYSTVDLQHDQCFTPEQVKNLPSDTNTYTWGYEDGRGEPIQMTATEYFSRFVFDADYTQAPRVGVDQIITSGNALENLTEAYPDCHFVDFCYPSRDPANEGLDWCSLKLVFAGEKSSWYLVGVVHGEWTI